MVWGLTGGLVAGLGGGLVATVVHLPTRLLLTWIEGVALTTSRWPLGSLDAAALLAVAAGAIGLAAGRAVALRGDRAGAGSAGEAEASRGWGRGVAVGWVLQGVGALVVVGAIVRGMALAEVPQGFDEVDVALGAAAWRGGGAVVLVVDGRAVDRYVLSGLREASIRRVDVVVVRSAARTAHDTVDTLRRRWPGVGVVAPSVGGGPAVDGAVAPPTGATIGVGGLRLAVVGNSGGHLDVRVRPRLGVAPSPAVPP
jgi:hypothetical protein